MSKKKPVQFKTQVANRDIPEIFDVEPSEVNELSAAVHLIDVRGEDEFIGELGHVAGSKLMVLDTVSSRIGELPKDEPIVFICRSGGRSLRAGAFAKASGCQYVFNMKGGMLAWNSSQLPIEKK